jgi:hypothetical protein
VNNPRKSNLSAAALTTSPPDEPMGRWLARSDWLHLTFFLAG